MGSGITIKLTGFKELGDRLKAFGPKLTARGLRSANFAAAAVFRDAAKRTTAWNDVTGELRKNIRIFRRAGPQTSVHHCVGIKGLWRKYGNTAFNRRKRRVGKRYEVEGPYFYGRFLENGTSRMRPHPWLRPAFFANIDAAIEADRAALAKAVDKAASK